ncbi:hypothetical protein T06_13557 [Trichinella sp. T6]|nr:hypothetical protein T06_13557 [Trichinella sp. T6]
MCDYTGLVSFLPHHFLICPAFIVSRMIPNSTGSSLRQPKKPNNPPNSTVRRGRRFGGRQRNAAGSFSFHLQEMAKNNEQNIKNDIVDN